MTTFKSHTPRRVLTVCALVLSQTVCFSPQCVLAAEVRIAGHSVFNITAASGGVSADKRAETVQQNLDNALVAAKDRSPSSVNITYVKGLPVITLGGYQVVTVDSLSAKQAHVSPAVLAKQWADGIRQALVDQTSINDYVAQLTGTYVASAPQPRAARTASQVPNDQFHTQSQPSASYSSQDSFGSPGSYSGYSQTPTGAGYGGGYGGQGMRQGRVVYAPAGLVIPIQLRTSISTQVARPGDMIEASVSQTVYLGDAQIPMGTAVIGQITDAASSGRFQRSGQLGIKFNRIRTPDGIETPISAHLVGGIGKYSDIAGDGSDQFKGETWKAKVGQTAIRGALGAGLGAALGTAVGAISGSAGTGAWSGTAIGGGLGLADALILRKGREVIVPSGTSMQLQLDAPVSVAGQYQSGNF